MAHQNTTESISKIRALLDKEGDKMSPELIGLLRTIQQEDPEEYKEFILPLLDGVPHPSQSVWTFVGRRVDDDVLKTFSSTLSLCSNLYAGEEALERFQHELCQFHIREGGGTSLSGDLLERTSPDMVALRGECSKSDARYLAYASEHLQEGSILNLMTENGSFLKSFKQSGQDLNLRLLSLGKLRVQEAKDLGNLLAKAQIKGIKIRSAKGDDISDEIRTSGILQKEGLERVTCHVENIENEALSRMKRVKLFDKSKRVSSEHLNQKISTWQANHIEIDDIYLGGPLQTNPESTKILSYTALEDRGMLRRIVQDVRNIHALNLSHSTGSIPNQTISECLRNGKLESLFLHNRRSFLLKDFPIEGAHVPTLKRLIMGNYGYSNLFATMIAKGMFPNLEHLRFTGKTPYTDSDHVVLSKIRHFETKDCTADRILPFLNPETIESIDLGVTAQDTTRISIMLDDLNAKKLRNLRFSIDKSTTQIGHLWNFLGREERLNTLSFLRVSWSQNTKYLRHIRDEEIRDKVQNSALPKGCLVKIDRRTFIKD
jgi:hypothetical protein